MVISSSDRMPMMMQQKTTSNNLTRKDDPSTVRSISPIANYAELRMKCSELLVLFVRKGIPQYLSQSRLLAKKKRSS